MQDNENTLFTTAVTDASTTNVAATTASAATAASVSVSDSTDFNSASGPVTIRMNNDYLFRALLQRNNKVLTIWSIARATLM